MATADTKAADDAIDDRTKPPFLRRVRIRGYKSIAFCDVTLEPLTVLVGRNAAGKSNFLDALAFLRDAVEINVTKAVERHGGWRTIPCKMAKNSGIEFRLELGLQCGQLPYRGTIPPVAGGEASFPDLRGKEFTATFSLNIEENDVGAPVIVYEALELTDSQGMPADGYKLVRGGNGEDYSQELSWRPGVGTPAASQRAAQQISPYRPDHTLLASIGFQPFLDAADGIRFMGFYSPHPDAIRQPQKFRPLPMLEKDCRNLASVIRNLGQTNPSLLQRAKQYLSHIVPDVDDFSVMEIGSFEAIRFINRAPDASGPLEFDAENMSDGTLRVLCNIMAVMQQVPTYGNPSIVGIEEPETALHPHAVNALVDALDEATLRTQVLLTTHSVQLLDNPTIQTKNVRVVEMVDGQTVIGPVDSASVEIVQRNLNTLGGLERDNQLEADLDDRERQQLLSKNGQEPHP